MVESSVSVRTVNFLIKLVAVRRYDDGHSGGQSVINPETISTKYFFQHSYFLQSVTRVSDSLSLISYCVLYRRTKPWKYSGI